MNKYILETDNLTKLFKKEKAVEDVSLKVRPQCIYGLLGSNGAGKSTFLKMVAGVLEPTAGKIFFQGQPWQRKDLYNIGSLIESPAIYGDLTAYENLKIHILLLGLEEGSIKAVLDQVDLKDTGNKKASQFSLGMKQRLGIGIALLGNPKLLILDEPTNGLDPMGIQDMRALIRSFPNKGITVILSSHLLSEVEQVADYIGIINQGIFGYESKIDKKENLEELFMNVIKKTGRAGM